MWPLKKRNLFKPRRLKERIRNQIKENKIIEEYFSELVKEYIYYNNYHYNNFYSKDKISKYQSFYNSNSLYLFDYFTKGKIVYINSKFHEKLFNDRNINYDFYNIMLKKYFNIKTKCILLKPTKISMQNYFFIPSYEYE